MAIEHTGILQIHVSVTDIERSVAFYRDVLGLRHLFTVQGQPMAFFDAVGVRLYLAVPEDERFRSRPVVYYGVADLDDAHETAVARWCRGDIRTAAGAPRRHHRAVDRLCPGSGRDADRPESGKGVLTARVSLG